MNKLPFLIFAVLLVGCTTVPVKQKFPDSVAELREKCPQLAQIEGERVAITDMLKVVIANYTTYYQCANKVDGWNEWYDKQKKIFEEANK
jgi:pectin methylesterase-like acyl-CoA thioesterase